MGNPDKAGIEDLLNFDNPNAVFYPRQGRFFASEFSAFRNAHLARKVAIPYDRKNEMGIKNRPLSNLVDYVGLREFYMTIQFPNLFALDLRMGPTEKDEELMRLVVEIRHWRKNAFLKLLPNL